MGKKVKTCGIYLITSPTGDMYVGQSIDIYGRWKDYMCLSCKEQKKLYNSLKKYGSENHKKEIIHYCERAELNKAEIHFIYFYNTFNTPHGMNLTSGGDSFEMSEESKKKMSVSKIGRKLSEETKRKMSASAMGRVIPLEVRKNYGKHQIGVPLSEEHKKKLSIAKMGDKNILFGKKRDPEIVKKIKQANRGKVRSVEVRKKYSEAQLTGKNFMRGRVGDKHPGFGKKMSDVTKKKMSASHLERNRINALNK